MISRLLVIASLLLCCTGCLPERSTLPLGGVPARGVEGEMRVLSESEKRVVRASVLTAVPNSAFAQFRWTKLPKAAAETEYYCAQLNGQTAGGQWVGFRPFVVLLETSKNEVHNSKLVELAPDRLEIASVVSKCRENGLDAFATVESDGAGVIGAVGR